LTRELGLIAKMIESGASMTTTTMSRTEWQRELRLTLDDVDYRQENAVVVDDDDDGDDVLNRLKQSSSIVFITGKQKLFRRYFCL
jgi:hypothetical protein